MRTALLSLILLAGCATISTTTLVETTGVTKRFLISQEFGRFQDAVALSTDQFGNTYVLDRGAPSVIKYSDRGDSLGVISGFGREQYQFDMPSDIDARLTNSILIADQNNHRIERYTKDFAYSATLQRRQNDQEQLRFGYPSQIASDDAGSFYMIDGENKRVLRVGPGMRVERIVGAYTNATSTHGVLVNPTKIAVDGYENLVVYDDASRALVAYDNLGNVLRRRDHITPLTSVSPLRALAARGDTLFALMSLRGSASIWLFHTATLTRLGVWELMIDGDPAFRDLDIRDGITLLTPGEAMRANISVKIGEPVK